MKILLKIAFVGTNYCGWQAQVNGRSVQQTLTAASEKLFGFPCDITGCSRTDSGVHANCFCATVSQKGESGIYTTVPLERLPRALNTFLPDDVSVFSAEYVDSDFHPRYSVKSKEYVYKIHTRPERDAFLSGRVWHLPRVLATTCRQQVCPIASTRLRASRMTITTTTARVRSGLTI